MTPEAALAARVDALVAPELDPGYRRRVQTVMRWLPPSPDTGSHVLDVGCGRGYYLHYYAQLGQRRITGVERDATIVARARALTSRSPSVNVVHADAAALPFASSSFSGAVLSEILEHVPDDAAVLRETFRVLGPGATLVVTVPHANFPWPWDPPNFVLARLGLPPIRRGLLAGIWAEHERLYRIDELQDRIRSAGFVIDETRAFLRRCLPFAPHLIYGIGKPLLESGVLPKRLANAIDRGREVGESGGRSPVASALRALLSIGDADNREHEGFDVPTLNLCVRARKPR